MNSVFLVPANTLLSSAPFVAVPSLFNDFTSTVTSSHGRDYCLVECDAVYSGNPPLCIRPILPHSTYTTTLKMEAGVHLDATPLL
jgi:hypothetical protein